MTMRLTRPLCGMLIALAGLSACSHAPKGGAARPATIQAIGNAQRMEDVVALLEAGDTKHAERSLHEMVKNDPADHVSAALLESIQADPVALLGAKSFSYRVQVGDRLPELSRRFLGDRLKFYALARYNGIAVPASLKAGQLIRIPGDEPPPRPATPPPAPQRPAEPPRPAPPRPAAKAPAANPARAAQLRAAGLAALNQGQVARAVVLLHQASILAPADPLIRRDLERAQRIRATVKARR